MQIATVTAAQLRVLLRLQKEATDKRVAGYTVAPRSKMSLSTNFFYARRVSPLSGVLK